MLATPCKNAYEIAKEVQKQINMQKDYVLKLEQFQNPTESLCWLGLRSYEWPAYSHVKYVFFNDVKDGRNLIFCGLHVERGLTKAINESSTGLLSDEWTWHSFYRDVSNGRI